MKKILTGLVAGAALFAVSACLLPAGSGEGLNSSGEDTVGDGGSVVVPPDTNLTFVFQKVFQLNGCTSCHSGSNPSGGMNLSSVANARAAFFNLATDSSPHLTTKAPTVHPIHRIQPNSPDSSYLYQKVSGVFSTPAKSTPDDRMPRPPFQNLDANELTIIRRWIEKGAPLQ